MKMKKSFKIACIVIGVIAGLASLNARKKEEDK